MSRIYLQEGIHTLNIKYLDSAGTNVYTEQIVVQIKRNEKSFVVTKSFKH
jgi:hypothetical protein